VTTLHLRARGPDSKYEIWARVTDPHRWSEWVDGAQVGETGVRLRVGLEATLARRLGSRDDIEVVEVNEPAMRWTWKVGSGRRAIEVEHDVSDGYASATIRGSVVDAWRYLPLARRQLRRLVGSTTLPREP
jgi:hypothetical protein